MPKGKHYVFSTRTTGEGLSLLDWLKADLGLGWEDLALDTACACFNSNGAAVALQKARKMAKGAKLKGKSEYVRVNCRLLCKRNLLYVPEFRFVL